MRKGGLGVRVPHCIMCCTCRTRRSGEAWQRGYGRCIHHSLQTVLSHTLLLRLSYRRGRRRASHGCVRRSRAALQGWARGVGAHRGGCRTRCWLCTTIACQSTFHQVLDGLRNWRMILVALDHDPPSWHSPNPSHSKAMSCQSPSKLIHDERLY